MSIRVGFVGFGEVASIFSAALIKSGAEVWAYDALLCSVNGEETLIKRCRADGIRFVPLPDLVAQVDYVFSTVTTTQCEVVAKEVSSLLRAGQTYIDLNSTSADTQRTVHDIIGLSGADFVEGVILGAVGVNGADTKILLSGDHAERICGTLKAHGLNVTYYGTEIGKASTFKLLRSIFSKGMEALLLELCIAGSKADLHEELWEDISLFMSKNRFEDVATNWLLSHVVACERRFFEVRDVVKAMEALGVDPIMTSSTLRIFERSVSLGLNKAEERPSSIKSVIDNFTTGV